MIRFLWIASRGYRLRPWDSPYLRWRIETYAGIPAESIDRVWEKFYRVARDGQEKDEESTGLGLSYVKEVIEQHGGSVSVESEVGRGSKFSFALPRL